MQEVGITVVVMSPPTLQQTTNLHTKQEVAMPTRGPALLRSRC